MSHTNVLKVRSACTLAEIEFIYNRTSIEIYKSNMKVMASAHRASKLKQWQRNCVQALCAYKCDVFKGNLLARHHEVVEPGLPYARDEVVADVLGRRD